MIPTPFSVNELLGLWTPFPQHLFPLFRIDYSFRPVPFLWIKQARAIVFEGSHGGLAAIECVGATSGQNR